MGSEKIRPWYSGDPRRFPGPPRWEEITERESTARNLFTNFKDRLETLGINIPKNAKVLEIGTGEGELTKYLQKIGMEVVGVDARPRHEANLPIAKARVEQLPFADGTFDLVLSVAIFDDEVYRQDQSLMAEEIARVLKSGGIYGGLIDHKRIEAQDLHLILSEEGGSIAYAKE